MSIRKRLSGVLCVVLLFVVVVASLSVAPHRSVSTSDATECQKRDRAEICPRKQQPPCHSQSQAIGPDADTR